MTQLGTKLLVDAEKMAAELPEVMKAVEQGRTVDITRGGKSIAEIRPTTIDPLQVHPELAATQLSEDAFAPLTDDEWPEDCR